MVDPDILVRRARDLERHHRNTAERRARGLCLKCGKRPPRAPPQPVRAVCREAAARRPWTLSPAHRRACRPGPVPQVRQGSAGARAERLRILRREEPRRRPRLECEAPGGGQAAPQPREGPHRRAPPPSPAGRRAPRAGPLPRMRHAPARGRCQRVRALRRSAPDGRTRPPREGQRRGQALWRPRPREAPQVGAREEPAACPQTPRSGPVRPLRCASSRRRRQDLRGVP